MANLFSTFKLNTFILLFILFFVGLNCSNNDKSQSNNDNADKFYFVDPYHYQRLDGVNLPGYFNELEGFNLKLTINEYDSFSFLISSGQGLKDVNISFGDFKDHSGNELNVILDPSIVKVWYQAGYHIRDIRYTERKMLTQELLLKDDSLIIVDRNNRTNYLKVTNSKNQTEFIDISNPKAEFPANVEVKDAEKLLPFDVESRSYKQIWTVVKIPGDAAPGIYKGNITVLSGNNEIAEFPIQIEVLNFKLEEPQLKYCLYYHGLLRENVTEINSFQKTPAQLKLELLDMVEHGVLYPTNYEELSNIERNLKYRNSLGLPNDRLYFIDLDLFGINLESDKEIASVVKQVENLKIAAKRADYGQVYVYGIDEAQKENLTKQRKAWQAVRNTGAKIFVATTASAFDYVGDILDLAIIHGEFSTATADSFHSKGNEIFSYANPQVGIEDPEVYRRNYGIALWLSGYDGMMTYAYQKNFGHIWNDFDGELRFRDEVFAYPTSSGLIGTIQWEGFRKGVNDAKYISTLLKRISVLNEKGINADKFENFLENLKSNENLNDFRNNIIDLINETYLLETKR